METQADMRAVIETVEKNTKPTDVRIPVVAPEHGHVLVMPEGMKVVDIQSMRLPRLERPVRRKGSAHFTTLASLVEHTNRFKDADTVLFASDEPKEPSITAVLDYNRAGAEGDPRFGEHRGHYAFPLSEEWKFWLSVGRSLDQRSFAELIADRIMDVVNPDTVPEGTRALCDELGITPLIGRAKLKSLAKGLVVNVDSKVINEINLDTGEATLVFQELHAPEDAEGKKVPVPNGFCIAIPVFRGGTPYVIPVRMRYRVARGANGGSVAWGLEPYRADVAFREAFHEACTLAGAQTEVPLLFGRPES